VGSCKKLSRMGYYLALLHRFSNKVANILGEPSEVPAVPEPVAAEETVTEEEIIPEPAPAPEPVSFQQPEPTPAVEAESYSQPAASAPIPEPARADIGFDKSALFEALQTLGAESEPEQPAASDSDVEIDTSALIDALKPKTAPAQPASPASTFAASSRPKPQPKHDEDELFKISDKEAVLEALKVLGWEEPND
ncbi:MAG: hypothetical protein ACXQS8_05995, partial [Candidatus Helarchaeales archaeon]